MTISYNLKRSRRARRITITVQNDGGVSVTVPARVSAEIAVREAERFVSRKRDWILKKVQYFLSHPAHPLVKEWREMGFLKQKSYRKYAELAREVAKRRLEHFNTFYHFEYKRIFIKNSKSRWGSCSSRKNLNFNYKIYFLPPALQDYLVVHELCHLGEFNHSPAFWKLVERTIPDYKLRRKELKRIGA